MSREPISAKDARRMGRPANRSVIVQMAGQAYEVYRLAGGGLRVFRLELETIEPDTPEFEAVARAARGAR